MLFALLGLIFLSFALVALLSGAALSLFWGHLALGAGCLVYAATTSLGELRDRLGRDAGRRGLRQGSNALIQALALLVILGLVCFVSVRRSVRWDWTEAGVHSLTQGTRDVLRQVPEGGVEIYAFVAQGNQEPAREALELYAYENPRVRYAVFDPNQRPDLASRFEIQTDGVLVVCGGSCDAPQGKSRVERASEEEITKAIRNVITSHRKVYFLIGHGEGGKDDAEARGYSQAREALEAENLTVEDLLLANQPDVPKDADAVVIAGPSHSLLPRELQALDRYLRGGGSLLVLADPFVITHLEDQLESWGVELGQDVVVDEQIQMFLGPQIGVQPIVSHYGAHPITERMKGELTLFQVARSVRGAADAGDGVVELLSTGERSWAESDLERFSKQGVVGLDPKVDRTGPVALAVARSFPVDAAPVGAVGGGGQGEANPREGRLVVVGDADFASNRYVAQLANYDLFLNMMTWLVGEEAFITVDRKLPRASTAALTPGELANFRYLSLFVLPEVLLVLGIVNWWRRRS
jgi:ABC-type uncharacterized transport system involved in gliding motility auxiliary subunit